MLLMQQRLESVKFNELYEICMIPRIRRFGGSVVQTAGQVVGLVGEVF